ncbi:hypothetical protein J19TS2_56690 [Cohnella xylanilytica]|nr:hypothetical protein J19TS2_56690 [Cohnella xylanilytica]
MRLHRDPWAESEAAEKVDPPFRLAYERMMEKAIGESRGERKRRLLEEHGYLEKMFVWKVWWLAVGHLDDLHPEWEVRDLRGGVNFVDYAYIPNRFFEMMIECDGFGPHWRDISRRDFDRNSERQNLLLLDDKKLLRFTYDGIREQPSRCQQTVLYALAKWGQTAPGKGVKLGVYERAILHYSLTFKGERMTPAMVAKELDISSKTATSYMQSLADKGYMVAETSPTGRRMGFIATRPKLTQKR